METQSNKLKIEFGKPRYDWLPVSIEIGNFALEFKASGVLDDPLAELVSCLSAATQGTGTGMNWWLEPEEYSFQFNVMLGGNVQLSISQMPGSGICKHVISLTDSFEAVIVPFWRALRKLNPNDFTDTNWYPLPLEKLEKLTQLLKLRKLSG